MKLLNFIKTNSYDIFKMILNQVGISIFALIMTFATHQNNKLFIACGIIAVCVYLYLLYTMTYEIASKDKPAVDGGRKKPQYTKGFLISLCANALNIILCIALVISINSRIENPNYVPPENNDTAAEETEYTSEDSDEHESFRTEEENDEYIKTGWTYVEAVSTFMVLIFQAMYLALKTSFFENSSFIYLLYPIPAILTCGLAYYMGLKGKRLFFFLPERPHKPKNR